MSSDIYLSARVELVFILNGLYNILIYTNQKIYRNSLDVGIFRVTSNSKYSDVSTLSINFPTDISGTLYTLNLQNNADLDRTGPYEEFDRDL